MEAHELLKYNNWVVAGDVTNESKYAFRIMQALNKNKFTVSGVNPRKQEKGVYKSIKDIIETVEVLDLCINPVQGLEIVKEAKTMGINKILIQPGAESEEILNYCNENNIIAIEGCALVELSRL